VADGPLANRVRPGTEQPQRVSARVARLSPSSLHWNPRRRAVPDGAGWRRLATRLNREMVAPESFSACVGGRTAT